MPPSALSSPTRAPVALITGAARRIGAVIARTLHAAGFDLVLHYQHSDEAMHALQESLEAERPGSVLTLAADLADPLTPVRLVDAALHRFGQLHALVNNASSFKPTPVGQASQGDWDQLFASNARAPFFLSQAAAPALRIQQGCIVNLVDVYAKRPLPDHPIYCMAKAALVMMTQSLARDLGPHIRVNAVAPGAILWPDEGKSTAAQQNLLQRTALQRTGHPDDIAEAVRWLIQDAHYTTGHVLTVDGGRTLNI
ncbi:MAG: pteridine reductase [Aquimonas sp.]|nr:pteridine reductase [Xanthomonadales bacterium]MCC6505024.1 pteridine reductase [Aquimonas sp.]